MKISYSMISSFLRCAKSYEYGFEKRLKRKTSPLYFLLGSLVHLYFEHAGEFDFCQYMEGYCTEHQLMPEERDEARIIKDKATKIGFNAFTNFVKYFHPLAVEQKFSIPISPDITIVGTIDMIAREKSTGQLWVIDHKTRKTFQSVEAEEWNLQNMLYMKAAQVLGYEPVGSITHQIFNELPALPKINKDGSLSKVAIRTTWDVYEGEIKRLGLNIADYEEMKSKLEEKKFFEFTKVYHSMDKVANVWHSVIIPAAESIFALGIAQRAISPFNCSNCQFSDLCSEELRGKDPTTFIEHNFVINDYLEQYDATIQD